MEAAAWDDDDGAGLGPAEHAVLEGALPGATAEGPGGVVANQLGVGKRHQPAGEQERGARDEQLDVGPPLPEQHRPSVHGKEHKGRRECTWSGKRKECSISEDAKRVFYNLAVCAKLNLPHNHPAKNILIQDIYEEAMAQKIPKQYWDKFIEETIKNMWFLLIKTN